MPIDSSRQSRKGKGKGKVKGKGKGEGEGKRKLKGDDDGGQHKKSLVAEELSPPPAPLPLESETGLESEPESPETPEDNSCGICGEDEHFAPLCPYRYNCPRDLKLLDTKHYEIVCICGQPVDEDGSYTCGWCLPTRPGRTIVLKHEYCDW